MAIITISRGTMSGGKKLAEMLSEKLGYTCISREIIIKTADDYGIPERKLFEAIQKGPSIFQKLTFERERYLAFIQATLCEYVKDDNVVYHGHAGHFLLGGVEHVLRIRIVADLKYRTGMAMELYKITEKEAEKKIREVDQERIKWSKFLYGQDWRSPELYDIIFNIEHANLDFVCEMVQHAVKQPQFQSSPESRKAMNDLLMASRIRAALARIHQIRLELLEIKADDGNVIIRGRAKSQEMLDSILEVATGVPGVVNVDSQVDLDYHSLRIE